MPNSPGTLEALAGVVGQALSPLAAQLSPANVISFLSELGLQFPPELLTQGGFSGALTAGSQAAGALPGLIAQLATDVTAGDDAGIAATRGSAHRPDRRRHQRLEAAGDGARRHGQRLAWYGGGRGDGLRRHPRREPAQLPGDLLPGGQPARGGRHLQPARRHRLHPDAGSGRRPGSSPLYPAGAAPGQPPDAADLARSAAANADRMGRTRLRRHSADPHG